VERDGWCRAPRLVSWLWYLRLVGSFVLVFESQCFFYSSDIPINEIWP
jgi:hypothetical protein